MARLYFSAVLARAGFGVNGVARRAAEKFFGAWLACILVMSRGDFPTAFSLDHARIASVCGGVGAAAAVALLVQMDRNNDSVSRQATISAISTFVGDVVARQSYFSPQWIEPMITAAISAGMAIAFWQTKRLAKGLHLAKADVSPK